MCTGRRKCKTLAACERYKQTKIKKMKTKVYVSLPITGHDLEETKKYANQVKKWLEEKGYH